MHKRASFSHEQEVRAVIWEPPVAPPAPVQNAALGKAVEVDIAALIKDVYVAPDFAPMLIEVVQGLVEQAGLNIEVKQSGVNAPPGY